MKKKVLMTGMVLAVLFSFTACGKSEDVTTIDDLRMPLTEESTDQSQQDSTEGNGEAGNNTTEAYQTAGTTDQQKSDPGNGTDGAEKVDRAEMMKTYASVLEGIYADNIYPDGTECGFEPSCSVTDNHFAVCDIDSDGEEELIVQYSTACMACMLETIYKYQPEGNTVEKEFSEWPALHYYDNELIRADWSHNQGMAGEFWPYTLYRYDPFSDTYQRIAMVDAWTKEYFPTDYAGNAFPDFMDTEGDGIVYYIMTGDEYDLKDPVNTKDYNTWRDSQISDAKEIQITYLNLTEENIQKIMK